MSGASILDVRAIEFRCGAYDWEFARDNAATIDANWANSQAAQPKLFDGRIYLGTDVAVDEAAGLLRATAFETSFRNFLGWREAGMPAGPVFNVFSMAALRSADGAFLLGEMAPGTASAGRLYFPAGTPDPSDVTGGFVDLDANMRRELLEETGISYESLKARAGWRVVILGQRIACMKELVSPGLAAEIIARFERFRDAEADPELVALVPVRAVSDIQPERMPDFMALYLRAGLAGRF